MKLRMTQEYKITEVFINRVHVDWATKCITADMTEWLI